MQCNLNKKQCKFLAIVSVIMALLCIILILAFNKDFTNSVTTEMKKVARALSLTSTVTDDSTEISEIIVDGKKIAVTSYKYDYQAVLNYEADDVVTVDATKLNVNQTITGLGDYLVDDSREVKFTVTSADKSNSKTFSVKIIRQHSAYLRTLSVNGYKLNDDFQAEKTQYTMYKPSTITSVQVYATACDKDASIAMSGNTNLANGSVIKVVCSKSGYESTTYSITCIDSEDHINYPYSGSVTRYVVPYTGKYKMQCWGARGGGNRQNGSFRASYGRGGYAQGDITLYKGQEFYIYVGGHGGDAVVGRDSPGGYNGGGLGTWDYSDDESSGGGGGATDIRLKPLVNPLNNNAEDPANLPSLRSRIMVAGGAGGTSWCYRSGDEGGAGGGVTGLFMYYQSSPVGTQTSGYLFGMGRNAWGTADSDGVGGGGGGYYGGQTNNYDDRSSGAGGSGYVSGQPGCIAVKSEEDTTPKVATYSKIEDSYHYSGEIFTSTRLDDGNTVVPTYDGTGTMTGNQNDGYAKISLLSLVNEVTPITNITVDNGTLTREINPSLFEYDVKINPEKPIDTITITPNAGCTVEGGNTRTITTNAGNNVEEFIVTDNIGQKYTYKLNLYREPSSYSKLSDLTIAGQTISDFNPDTLSYSMVLPYYVEETAEVGATKSRPNQTIEGIGTISTAGATSKAVVKVISEDGNNSTTYTLVFNRVPTTKLKSLDIKGQDFASVFKGDKYDYSFEVTPGVVSLTVTAVPYDAAANVKIVGAGYIKEGLNKVTITVSEAGIEDTVYTLNVQKGEVLEAKAYEFPYTGSYQTFTAETVGYYKFECWGACGGNSKINGSTRGNPGYGGYTCGTLKLNAGDTFYIYVGQRGQNAICGSNTQPSFNGGGLGTWDNRDDEAAGSGGGATDIRTESGSWNSAEGLKSRIMVAGAGGGASWDYTEGSAGGLNGYTCIAASTPGGQTTGYQFGIGENGHGVGDSDGVAGGGAGYYGGKTSDIGCATCGAGGSSFISGHDGCDAIDKDGKPTGQAIHYSGFKFKDTQMIDGRGFEWTDKIGSYTQMEDPNGNYVRGNSGNGYARVTRLKDPSQDNLLKEIQLDKGTLSPVLSFDTTDYTIQLNPEDTKLTVYGVLDDIKASVEGNGTYDILPGDNTIKLNVTAESGDVKTYTLTVKRDASSVSKANNITIDGLIESLISVNPKYGKLDPDKFDKDVHEYSMTVPSRIKKLTFNVEKGHPYQTVTGDGEVSLADGENKITINIKSEDGTSNDTYVYNINRDVTGNCLLKSLSIDNVDTGMNFDQDTLEYFVTIPSEIDHLDITAIPEIETITPEIVGNTDLKTGLNDVRTIVNATNGEQLVYIIHAYRMMSGNTFLSALKVSDKNNVEYNLSPNFNKILDTYTINVKNDIDSAIIEATPEVTTSKVSNVGQMSLKTGNNNFKINVTAQDGSIGVYNLNIIREKSNNNNLSKLECTNGQFDKEFTKDNTQYSMNVDATIKALTLNIETEDSTATYEVIGNSNFQVGENNVIVRVSAENGDIKNYIIKVNRAPSSDNYLTALVVDHGTFNTDFNKETEEYNVDVDNEYEVVNIQGTKEDINSTIAGLGNYSLDVGNNDVNIKVTAEDGGVRTYKLHINRKLNNNAKLAKIENNENLAVNQATETTYEMDVQNDINKLCVRGIPQVETSKVLGNGKYNLAVGRNLIGLNVIAQDGTQKNYALNILREKSNNANLKQLIVNEAALDRTFDKDITMYTVKVEQKVSNVTVDALAEDADAKVEILGNTSIKDGYNRVIVRVTASDGITVKDYIVNTYRQQENTGSNKLINLSVDQGTLTPTFDSNVQMYTDDVPNSITSINVTAITEDSKATVAGTGNYPLSVGINVIAVKVTSTDGIEKSYQVKVNRAKSSNADLSSLYIEGSNLSPVFSSSTTEYNIDTVLSKLNISYATAEQDSTCEITGNENFENGLNIVTLTVTAPDGVTTKQYKINAVKKKSSNNNLKSLEVVGFNLSPEFTKTNLVYKVDVDNTYNSVIVKAEADDANATVTGIGSVSLKSGKNTISVEVTAEDGTMKTYTLLINKAGSDNNFLSNIILSNGSLDPVFDKNSNNYKVDLPYENDNIEIQGITEDENATINGNGKFNLNVGENNIQLKVVSESGKENDYNIVVNRKYAISAKLSNIAIAPYSLNPIFNIDKNEYSTTVDNEITSLNLNVTTLDPNATYVVEGNENFVVGQNEVKIKVTSSDKVTTEEYKINVTRAVSSNNFLNYITVSQGTLSPSYVKTTMAYDVTVANEVTSINVDAEAEVSTSTVTGINTYNLNPGENTITLTCTSISGVTRTYTVIVNRLKNSNNYLKDLSIKTGSTNLEMSPTFKKDSYDYEVSVDEGTTKVQLIGTLENELSKVDGLGYVTINAGENNHQIIVTAEDGSQRTYNIKITRPKSNNNHLTELFPSVGELSPNFTYDGTAYSLALGNEDALLSFTANTENRFATVSGNEEEVVPDGISSRTVTVTAEDGTTRDYTINITRTRTDDARLKKLAIKSFTFNEDFDENRFEYSLTVPNDKFEITANEIVAAAKYEGSTISMPPQMDLDVLSLNKYTITVTAPDGYTTQNYTLNITRKKGSNSSLEYLAVSGYEMKETFDSDLKTYTLEVPKGTTEITADEVLAKSKDKYAKVEKMDKLDLTTGNKQYTVKVTSQDESSVSNYILNVEEIKSEDNYLKSLSVTPGDITPTFDPKVVNYTINVEDDVSEVFVSAEPQDPLAKITEGAGKIELNQKETQELLICTAEDGKERVYILNIIKADPCNRISGKVVTEDTINIANANVRLYKGDTVYKETTSGEDGTFKLKVEDDNQDTYNLVIKKDGYLMYKENNITFKNKSEHIVLNNINLIGGDFNNDHEIELDDLVQLNDNIGKTITEGTKEKLDKYDLNKDNIIDKLDRNILKKNYGQVTIDNQYQ